MQSFQCFAVVQDDEALLDLSKDKRILTWVLRSYKSLLADVVILGTYRSLDYNNFTGPIPDLSSLSSLQFLYVIFLSITPLFCYSLEKKMNPSIASAISISSQLCMNVQYYAWALNEFSTCYMLLYIYYTYCWCPSLGIIPVSESVAKFVFMNKI